MLLKRSIILTYVVAIKCLFFAKKLLNLSQFSTFHFQLNCDDCLDNYDQVKLLQNKLECAEHM